MTGYLDARTPFGAGRLVEAGDVRLWCHDSGGDGEPLLLLEDPPSVTSTSTSCGHTSTGID